MRSFAGGALVLAGWLAAGTAVADCTPERIEIDRGETRRLVLCADGIDAGHELAAPEGLHLDYQQHLRRCGAADKRPGYHVVLEAGYAAQGGDLTVADPSGKVACRIPVIVPDRQPLEGRLSGQDERYALEIRSQDGIDLRPACAAGLHFPDSDGMTLAVAAGARPRCTKDRLQVEVVARNARRAPAKIILGEVGGPGGTRREAVALVAPPPPAWTAAMAERDAKFIDVNGVRTRYFEKGSGEALLLVHGGQPSSMDGTAWDWQQNFDGLAERFHVHALDRLGQGMTDNPASLDDYQDYYPRVVSHVLGFMDAVGIERAHLVGHSQGGWPVTRISLDHPDRVASLTIVDSTMTAPPHDAQGAMRFYLYLTQNLHPPEGETLESARRGMELFSYTRNNITEQRVERLFEMTRQPKYAASSAWFGKSGMSPAHPSFRKLKQQVADELAAGKMSVPVLVVWGQNDPEGSLPAGLELFRLMNLGSPRARMHIFGDSGHIAFMEHPEEFNRLLIDFALEGR